MVARIIVGLSFGILSACTAQPSTTHEPRYASSSITIAEPGFAARKGDRFAWYGPVEVITDGMATLEQDTLDRLRERFENRLVEQGFVMVASRAQADYLIGAAIVIGAPITESELVERFEIAPTMNTSGQYNPGTLIVRLLTPVGHRTRWRSAIEIFDNGEQSPQTRLQRMDQAINTFTRRLAP